MTVKVLLDTDIGSDIDDALALAYLLAQPECELLGITTVSGAVEKRAMLASALCKVAGKAIPIFPGAELPLLGPTKQPEVPQHAALTRWEHDTDFPRGEAIEFLRRTIRQHPGEVILLAIGPFTNIALLFATDLEIPALLKGLVVMGGVFTNMLAGTGPLEWNAMNDPYATARLYQAAIASHRSIGLDVTCQVKMDAQQFRARCNTPLLRPALDFAEVWFQHMKEVTFHDPLAAATIFDDTICSFKRGTVEVETTSTRLGGFTYWDRNAANPRHEVALQVHPERFFDHYLGVFAR